MFTPKDMVAAFVEVFKKSPQKAFFSPGRINIIGEHIDYNGGHVLPAAINLGITCLVAENEKDEVEVFSYKYNKKILIDLHENLENRTADLWVNYIKGMLWLLKSKGVRIKGKYIYIKSDLPIGAGLSSSAALECLIGYVFNQQFYASNRKQLALDAQYVENNYVGVNCGIMDQFAVALGKKDSALLLDCTDLTFESIPFVSETHQFLIINSNKSRSLTESRYNDRRIECEKALQSIQAFSSAENLCTVNPTALAYLEDDIEYIRAKHVLTEQNRVEATVFAMEKGDDLSLGRLLTASHASLANDFEVSCEELDIIVEYATKASACLGARMIGAGFGGCCIALVEKSGLNAFEAYLKRKYEQHTDCKLDIYQVEFSDGVREVTI